MSKVKSQNIQIRIKAVVHISKLTYRFIFSITKLIFIVQILIFLQSCKNEPPIPEEKFVKIYVDLLFIQDTTAANQSLDSLKQVIFQNYDVTDEMYRNNVDFYNESPEKWDAFFDKATAYVEELKAKQPE